MCEGFLNWWGIQIPFKIHVEQYYLMMYLPHDVLFQQRVNAEPTGQ